MVAKNRDAIETSNSDVVITRVFDAPREAVWRAWTEPERFMRWWGPKDFTSPSCEIDLRAGGKFLWCMRWPDGRDMYETGEFLEVVPLERLVYTDGPADNAGNAVPPSRYGLGGDSLVEARVTVTFEDHEGGTKMTLTHAGLSAFGSSAEVGEMVIGGWNESFDKLAASLR